LGNIRIASRAPGSNSAKLNTLATEIAFQCIALAHFLFGEVILLAGSALVIVI
jgi:hypothetical protein